MTRSAWVLPMALAAVLSACAGTSGTLAVAPMHAAVPATCSVAQAASNATVTIQDFAFAPADVTIRAGCTVTWINRDSATHTATADASGGFDTGDIAAGATSQAIKFDKPGRYPYHCTYHSNMHGTITVQ